MQRSSKKNMKYVLLPGPVLGGAELNWEQFRSAKVPSQLATRSVELGTGPIGSNWFNCLMAGPDYYISL